MAKKRNSKRETASLFLLTSNWENTSIRERIPFNWFAYAIRCFGTTCSLYMISQLLTPQLRTKQRVCRHLHRRWRGDWTWFHAWLEAHVLMLWKCWRSREKTDFLLSNHKRFSLQSIAGISWIRSAFLVFMDIHFKSMRTLANFASVHRSSLFKQVSEWHLLCTASFFGINQTASWTFRLTFMSSTTF
jgi:hypothetical protein